MNATTPARDADSGARKSLMLESEQYARISAYAKEARVPRHVVVDAMLDLVDKERLSKKLLEIRAKQKVEDQEMKKKQAALRKAAENLSMEQISALLDKLGITAE